MQKAAAQVASGAGIGAACLLQAPSPASSYENSGVTDHIYTRKEVEMRVCVTYKNGIYDITNLIDNHPGGTTKSRWQRVPPLIPFGGYISSTVQQKP